MGVFRRRIKYFLAKHIVVDLLVIDEDLLYCIVEDVGDGFAGIETDIDDVAHLADKS